MSKRYMIAAIILASIAIIASYYILGSSSKSSHPVTITVCNAGSLTIPLEKIAAMFEKDHGIRVLIEPSGSVEAVRKVTDLGVNCDVVAVSDYRLIPRFMVPRYASWYIVFASNSIVIAYTNHSRYATELARASNPLEAFRILARSGVRYGFSDPNRDPCGYRSVGVIGLAALELHNLSLLRSLVIDKIPGSSYRLINGTLDIYVPASIEPRGNLVIRPKEVDLVALLESGVIDYAFEYKSVAVQHGLRYVELPRSISLGDPSEKDSYARVVVHILVGTSEEKAIPMAPIAYGVTVPLSAQHPREAILFVKYLLQRGPKVFDSLGQPFLEKPLGYGEVPGELRSLVRLVAG